MVSKAIAEAKMLAPAFAFETINDAIQWVGAYWLHSGLPARDVLTWSSIMHARRGIYRSNEDDSCHESFLEKTS
jgi:hypothetical protein